jgi:chromosome segregation ATPase
VTTTARTRPQTSTTSPEHESSVMHQSMATEAEQANSFFIRLRSCAFISFALLVAATVLHLPPWAAMLGGGAPLVYYHLGYLAPRASKGLSQTAIDSVYYFGFLVTIAALGMSAVSLATSQGKTPLEAIAFQFGLGLLATGYAVWARMHLNAISVGVDETSPEEVLDRYIQRSRELVVNVELAATSFTQLAATLMQKSQEVADAARQTTEKSMQDVAKLFEEQLSGTLDSAKQGVTEVRSLVSELSFAKEREQLVTSVRETLRAVNALNTSLNELANRSNESARNTHQGAVTQAELNARLGDFERRLDAIGGEEGALAATVARLNDAQASVAHGAASMGEVVQELGEMAGTVSGIGPTFKSIKTLTQKAHEQLDALASSTERLGQATGHLERTANLTQGLADGVERAAKALPSLGEQAQALEAQLSNLSKTAGAVEQQLDGMPRPTEEAVQLSGELREALASVARVVAGVASEAKELASHSAQHTHNVQQTQRMVQEAATLQATVDAIQNALQSLSGTVMSLNKDLQSSTAGLKGALDTVHSTLETQVKRSGDVAQLFGERMTSVAQIIIDRTREARAEPL